MSRIATGVIACRGHHDVVIANNTDMPRFEYRPDKHRDDWQPKPPKAKELPNDNEDSGGWFDWMFTPTENGKAAQEAVRNSPNNPEGAKP